MTTWQHAPALLTHPDGFALPNAATTSPVAGAVLTSATSTGGATTFVAKRWRHTGAPGVARLELAIPNTPRVALRYDFVVPAWPTGDNSRVIEIGTPLGAAFRVVLQMDGTLRLVDAAGALLVNPQPDINTTVLPAGSSRSLFVAVEPGATTTTGKLRVELYDSHTATTPIRSYSRDDYNLRAATTISYVWVGRLTSTAGSTLTIETAGLQAKDTDLGPIAPLSVAGLGNAGPDQINVEPGRTVVLNGIGTSTWTQTAGPAVTLEATGVAGQATFVFPHTLNGVTLSFSYGGDTMNVAGLRSDRSMINAAGVKVPAIRRLITLADLGGPDPTPDQQQMLPVRDLVAVQLPGTQQVRTTWSDPNINPASAYYAVSEDLFGDLSTTVTTTTRTTGILSPGDYRWNVSCVSASGATSDPVAVTLTVVPVGAGPTITPGTEVTALRSWSQAQTFSPASTVVVDLRKSGDSTAPVVATFTQATAATSVNVTFTGLEPGTTYNWTERATRPDTGATTVRSGTFVTTQATTGLKYERVGPVLASELDPIPAGWPGWNKYRILSQTTYSVNDGPTLGFSGKITFPANADGTRSNNVVFMPRGIAMSNRGGLTLEGGHHLAVYGGEIKHDTTWSSDMYLNKTATKYGQAQRVSFQPNQQTGDIYIEGLWVHGLQINDPMWMNTATTTITGRKRTITLQNCWFADANAPNMAALKGPDYTAPGTDPATGAAWAPGKDPATGVTWTTDIELHPDGIQLLGTGTNTVVRLYQVQIDSAYQGIMDNMGESVELEMERVHLNLCYPLRDGTTAWEQRNGYPFYFGGPVRVTGGTVVVREPPRRIGTAQRQPGYPETATKWVGISQVVTETPADASWRPAAWTGESAPGRAYKATAAGTTPTTPSTPTTPPTPPAASTALTVDGNLIKRSGVRWVAKGATLYWFPYNEAAMFSYWDDMYAKRVAILDKMKAMGMNSVRLAVTSSPGVHTYHDTAATKTAAGGLAVYLNKVADWIAKANERGIVVSLCDWASMTDKDAAGVHNWVQNWAAGTRYQPFHTALMNKIGTTNPGVIIEPFNEPGENTPTTAQWYSTMREVLTFYRATLGFKGLLQIDTPGWSWAFPKTEIDGLITLDATLTGTGKSNIAIANHRYGNSYTTFSAAAQAELDAQRTNVATYPIIGTEYGFFNGTQFPNSIEWVRGFFAYLAQTMVPAGHNGMIGTFSWSWVDANNMTNADRITLNANGNVYATEYLAKLPAGA